VKHPQILDGSIAGEVVQLGPGIKNLKLGDKVCTHQCAKKEEDSLVKFMNRSLGSAGENKKRNLTKNSSQFQNCSLEKSPKITPSNKQ